MSVLSQFTGGGVRSIQTGYVNNLFYTSFGGNTGAEDYIRWDITVNAVADTSKCVIQFAGAAKTVGSNYQPAYFLSTSVGMYIPTAIMFNTTTIRFMSNGNTTPFFSIPTYLTGRWTLIEYR